MEPYVRTDEPTSPPLPGERGQTVLDLRMEALAHAVHLAAKRLERGGSPARREDVEDGVVDLARRFEAYLTGAPDRLTGTPGETP